LVLSLAIASALALGITDFLAGATLRRDGRQQTALVYSLIASVLGAVLVVAALPLAFPEEFTANDLMWSIIAGIAIGVALPILMVGMARGPAGVVAPVLGLVTLAIPAVAGPLLGDQLSGWEIVGIAMAFPAAVLVSLSKHETDTTAPVRQAIAMGAAAGAGFGTAAVCFGQTSTAAGIAPGVVAQATTALILFAATLGMRRMVKPQREASKLAGAVGVLTAVAMFLSVLAYQRGPVAVVAAILGLAPGVTVLLAWLLTREKFSALQGMGFALGILAVVFFAVG
jgi:drug/metabolite transporter (DMT)-like permease